MVRFGRTAEHPDLFGAVVSRAVEAPSCADADRERLLRSIDDRAIRSNDMEGPRSQDMLEGIACIDGERPAVVVMGIRPEEAGVT